MKNGSIFLIQDDNQLLRMEETSYESEELLQKLFDQLSRTARWKSD